MKRLEAGQLGLLCSTPRKWKGNPAGVSSFQFDMDGFLATPLKPVILSGQYTYLSVLKKVYSVFLLGGVGLSPVLKRQPVCVGPFIYGEAV